MKTLLIDGNNNAWRLQKRLPTLTVSGVISNIHRLPPEGKSSFTPIQIIYGFLRLIRGSLQQFQPDVAIVCWDNGRSSYRQKLFPGYKANRDHNSTREKEREYKSVIAQIETLKGLLELLNIGSVSYPETEADDIIGISSQCLKGEKVIISSDQDMLHLVNKSVSVWSPFKTTLYTDSNFRKLLGLSPDQWLEMRALTGDKSDNIPGVSKGFGVQTAQELIVKYGSIAKLYESSVEKRVSKQGNRYALLYAEGAKELAYRNCMIMDLRVCSLRKEGAELAKQALKSVQNRHRIDKQQVKSYFEAQRFESLLKDFSKFLLPFECLDTEG